MNVENPVQRFLGLEEMEDVFFRAQQYNTTVNDQHFQTILLSSQAASSTSSGTWSCFTDVPTR